jgi:hypothetical protein
MKLLWIAVFVLAAPIAFAQIDPGDGPDNMQGIGDGCGGTMSADDCMFGAGTTTTQCTSDACPACAFDQTQTRSICYYLTGNFGYCSCSGNGVAYDRYGNKFANCNTSGSCVKRR